MKNQKILLKLAAIRTRLLTAIGIITLATALPSVSRATIVGPYAVDANTLHLWHMDDNNGLPFLTPTNPYAANYDAVTSNPQTSPITETNTPGQVNSPNFPGYPPTNFALQAQSPYTYTGANGFTTNYGLGYSVKTLQFSSLYPSYVQPNPLVASVVYTCPTNLSDFINTNTGAFTIECLINPQFNPTANVTYREIICGDNGFPTPQRGWLFRFNNSGGIEFNCGPAWPTIANYSHDANVKLPTSGPDAAVQGNWYHLAVTYTGFAPTNGDTANQFKMYWTLMDPTRTHDDLLAVSNNFLPMTNTENPVLVFGGTSRDSPINGVGSGTDTGFPGYIDEARISSVCRGSNDMMFNTNVFIASPGISISQTNYLVGYGQTLTIFASEIGTSPANQWYQNGSALSGQTNAALTISNVTFAAGGNYQLIATNISGSATGAVCQVTVGATFNGLFNTGVDSNGVSLYGTAANHLIDLHYQLVQSSDPNNIGPNAYIWGVNFPAAAASGPLSQWIGSEYNASGNSGTYSYQTQFQIDNGDPASATLSGILYAVGTGSGTTVQLFLNGVETDYTWSVNSLAVPTPFALTAANGLQAGSNTLVVTMSANSGSPPGGFQVQMTGICTNALPAGLPVITNQPPASQTVIYGATAVVPVVALGRPPLTYQWYSNGIAILGATSQNLSFVATNFSPLQIVGGQFIANYQVVVGNDSGYTTSSVDTVTIQLPTLTIASAGVPIWNPTNNETNIVVIFSTDVDPTTAATAGNYSLNGASVLSAAMGDAPNKVILGTSVLTPGTSYTLTVQNIEDTFGDTMSPSPASISVGIFPAATVLWVKANTGVTTDAGGVNQWNDLSGNGNNLFDSSGPPYEPQLATNTFNGYPVIRFAATNETYMQANDSPSLEITNNMSIFAVVNYATLAGNTNGMIVSKTANNNIPAPYDYYANSTAVNFLRGNGTVNADVTASKLPSTSFPHLLDVMMQGTTVTHRLDGNTNGSGTLSTTIADQGSPLYIGTRYDQVNRLSGNMAELIVIGSALTTNDVASIENYLATEYNLPTGTNTYPVITQQPVASTNANQGGTLTVAAAASGNPAVSYQWYDTNNVAITGQTNATLVVSNIQVNDSYYLQASNTFSVVDSSNVVVNVISGLNVNLGPASVTLYVGQSVTLSAVTLGTVPFYYQWNQNGSPVLNATNASYSATASLGSTPYSCTVSNAYNGYSVTNAGPVNLIGIAAPTNLYQTTVLGNHPVAYWQLSEGPNNGSGNNGAIAYDYAGGHNAAYTNTVLGSPGFSLLSSTDTAAVFGTFVPSNSYAGEINQSVSGLANISFATPSGGNAELSVEAWVCSSNATQGGGIVTKGYGGGGEQFDLDMAGNAFRFFVRDASGATHGPTSTVIPVVGQWYHVVGVFDGSNGVAHLYINGVDAADTTGIATNVGLLTATTTNILLPQAALVSIGARTSSQSITNYTLQFLGKIDDVALYNYALSPTQVHADYVAGAKNAIFNTSSTNIVFSSAANNLTLSWPANHTGWTLQSQTNSLSVGISTNWVNVSGSTATNQVVIPLNLTNGSVFYRLMYQH